MNDDILNNNDDQRIKAEGQFVVLDKLKVALDSRFNMQAVVEPSNAVARREIRVMADNIQLNRIPSPAYTKYVPYEGVINAVVSMRVSGGNTKHFLSAQAMQYAIAMAHYLEHQIVVIKDVAQKLDDMKPTDDRFNWMEIVGDAEIITAKEMSTGWAGNKDDDNYDNSDELFVYRKDWQVTIGITIHSHFYNPLLSQMNFVSEIDDTVIEVNHDSQCS
ncbi:hypothetical protein HJ158_08250 [Vibrio parahaemolyticus]|nr:hypothetical protein [Vibrio parahaemolyticus]